MKKIYYTLPLFLLSCIQYTNAQKSQQPIQRDPIIGNNIQSEDIKPPTLTCQNTFTSNLLPNDHFSLTIEDILVQAQDNVTPVDQLRFTLRLAGSGNGIPFPGLSDKPDTLQFDCQNLGGHALELWAMDLSGNVSLCEITITIEDEWGYCSSNNNFAPICIEKYCNGESVLENIGLNLKSDVNFAPPFLFFMDTFQIPGTGCYQFPLFIPISNSFTATPFSTGDPLENVSNVDLQILSDHIHGITPFTEPWQWVAADINNDQVVDSQDSLELSDMLAGVYQEFPHNQSWRFVRQDYVFPSPTPLSQAIPDTIKVWELSAVPDFTFKAIKVGDLNCMEERPPVIKEIDIEPPVITCLNGLSVNIMPIGKVLLWDSDFLLSVQDNITPTDQIILSMREAGTGTGFPLNSQEKPVSFLDFECTEQGAHTIELWAIDLAGNAAFCESTLIVNDNNGNCGPINVMGTLCVELCNHDGVEEAELAIFNDSISYFDMSNGAGCWELPDNYLLDSSYTLSLYKDDNPLNGVGTYDLLQISYHIDGTKPFTEPWQFIAADANKDNIIDTFDIIELRNLIMGNYSDLPNNSSWRFYRSDYVFPWPDPLSQPFPETIPYDELVDSIEVLFIGVKIGDLTIDCFGQTPVSEPISESGIEAKLFPNPTQSGSILQLNLPEPGNISLQISDLSGRKLFQSIVQLPAGEQALKIPESAIYTPGIYIWQLQTGGKSVAGKLIRI
ncbi:MAG: T9SS type A sorting domain-containing protein [Saprospiraceae bacterium]